jgi:transposase
MPRTRLRPLTRAEQALLSSKLRTKTLSARIHQRYRIVAELARGRSAVAVGDRVGCNVMSVYRWRNHFNASGFAKFEVPTNPNGAIPIVSGEQVRGLIRVALSRPEDLGLPCTHWSVAKLAAYCRDRGLLPPITDEWVRRLLHREGVSFQHSKTWKESPDPEFEAKKTVSSTSTPRRPPTAR